MRRKSAKTSASASTRMPCSSSGTPTSSAPNRLYAPIVPEYVSSSVTIASPGPSISASAISVTACMEPFISAMWSADTSMPSRLDSRMAMTSRKP